MKADAPNATVDGPIPYSVGAHGFPWSSVADLAELEAVGYMEQEFFFSGAVPGSTGPEPYASRLIVRHPTDSTRFNGTVVVEWLNVTAGGDIGVDWALMRHQIVRDGYAYIGVTAQPVGVCWLKTWDAVRYGTLTHPALLPGPCPATNQTETYSYDIFSQAGQAVRVNPVILGGLEVRQLLAAGTSQSARRLLNYVNGYHTTAGIYDGYLLHVIGGGGGGLVTNTSTEVLIVNSENEVLGYYPFRAMQPANVRYWEVAGAGHSPEIAYTLEQLAHAGINPVYNCEYPLSDAFIPMYPIGDAALDALNRWVSGGIAPPDSPLVAVIPGTPNTIDRDRYGNALGGIRLPQMEVPIARFIGTNGPPTLLCRTSGGLDLFDGEAAGATPNDRWDEPTIEQLYPNHGAYLSEFVKAVENIVAAGFMLQADAEIATSTAARRPVGK
jgi:hypothetical protein